MIFTTAKAALALLCLAGYSSAFALPAALQSRENTQCYKVKEGSGCSLTADYGLYACSDNLWDVVTCDPSGQWILSAHCGAPTCHCAGTATPYC